MWNQPQLLRAFREGDPEALRDVYVKHVDLVDAVVRTGFTTLGPPPLRVPGLAAEAARDVVQDVFLKAFRDSARMAYDGLRPYAPYLLRITKNVCIDRYRRLKHERLHAAEGLIDIDAVLERDAPLPESTPEDDHDFGLLAARTQQFVLSLDAEQRQFVELRFREELSQAEVAKRMAVTRRRVRTLEEQVLSGLRRALTPEMPSALRPLDRPSGPPHA